MTEAETKKAVRDRDGYCCTKCGMTRAEHFAKYEKDLEVHRVVPGSEYSLEGCVTVCVACHGPMPRRPHRSVGVNSLRLPGDMVDMARIIAAVSDEESMSDVISAAARPVLLKRLREIQEKGFGLPPKK
jgi:hypothetical protein